MYFVCLQSIILLKKSSDIDMITYGIIQKINAEDSFKFLETNFREFGYLFICTY